MSFIGKKQFCVNCFFARSALVFWTPAPPVWQAGEKRSAFRRPAPEQFQEKGVAAFRPELRRNKDLAQFGDSEKR
jgi:hypothetical protein